MHDVNAKSTPAMEANQRRVAFFNTRSGLPFRCIPANDGADTPRRPLPGPSAVTYNIMTGRRWLGIW
jgi:hypothetical protein